MALVELRDEFLNECFVERNRADTLLEFASLFD